MQQQRLQLEASHSEAIANLQQELQDAQRRVEGLQQDGAARSQLSLAAEGQMQSELEALRQSLTRSQQEQRQSQATVEQQAQVSVGS